MYGKIFDSMYEGTLYGHWQAIITMQQMIVLCDADGIVDMTPQAIAARTSIPLDIIKEGLRVLSEPDNESRTPGSDGRRIELIDAHRSWGWVLVNHQKYKTMVSHEEKREADRIRIAAKRKAEKDNKNNNVADCRGMSQGVAEVAHTDTDTDTDLKPLSGKPDAPPGFDRFWKVWPTSQRKVAKSKCIAVWKRKGLEAKADAVVAHVEVLAASDSWKTGYDPMPLTYLNQERWDGADLSAPAGANYGQCTWNQNGTREAGGRCPAPASGIHKTNGMARCESHIARN